MPLGNNLKTTFDTLLGIEMYK